MFPRRRRKILSFFVALRAICYLKTSVFKGKQAETATQNPQKFLLTQNHVTKKAPPLVENRNTTRGGFLNNRGFLSCNSPDPFLPLKGHFGFSGFRCLTFLLEHFDPKIVSRVLYVLQKIAKYPDADGRTYADIKI